MNTNGSSDIHLLKQDPSTSAYQGWDVKSRQWAKWSHEIVYVYGLYGILDGFSLSYSMVKYCFDLLYTDGRFSSSDKMHDWMMTPEGAVVAATESITLIAFSFIANTSKDNDKDIVKRYISILWPYCRDTLKGLKNAYKGIRGALQAAGVLMGQDMRYMMVPLGVVFGALSVFNRICMRKYVVEPRKLMTPINAKSLQEIQDATFFDEEACELFRSKILRQSDRLQRVAFLGAAYSGVVDGLYLYMGAIGLAVLTPPVFMVMTLCCLIFSLTCIATRMYEEYTFQRKFIGTQAKIELALCGKEFEILCAKLHELSDPLLTNDRESLVAEQVKHTDKLKAKIKEFEVRHRFLTSQTAFSGSLAVLDGLRNGLAVYSAIASVIFAVATIKAMFLVPFPPAFLIGCIIAGMACLVGCVTYSLFHHYSHLPQQNQKESKPFMRMLLLFKENKEKVLGDLTPTEVKVALCGGMVVDPSPQFFFQEWSEVARSFFSGLAKGQKLVDFTLNPLQEPDLQGHYHDTPIMFLVTVLSALVHAVALALRALARGFGRPELDAVKPKNPLTIKPDLLHEATQQLPVPEIVNDKNMGERLKCQENGVTSSDGLSPKTGSTKPLQPSWSRSVSSHSFFSRTSQQRSQSTNVVTMPKKPLMPSYDIIQDLALGHCTF